MNDNFVVKLVFGACFAILAICIVVLSVATYELLANGDKYDCKKTGRQTHSFIMAGKVMVPTVTDETICTKKG